MSWAGNACSGGLELPALRKGTRFQRMKRFSPRREEEFRDLLISKGLRVTEQRLALWVRWPEVKAPISHAELTERMEGAGLDRATVYRNLFGPGRVLAFSCARSSVISVTLRAAAGDEPDHADHPHLVCEDCGNVRCLPAGTVKLLVKLPRTRSPGVQLRGRCASRISAAS